MANSINFDENRYLELLKKEKTLINQGIRFWEESRAESKELFSYQIILENQIFYNSKDKYIFLVEEYLKENAGEDGAGLVRWEFLIFYRQDLAALNILEKEILEQGIQKLTTFYLDPKSTEFANLIYEIRDLCEFLTFDPEDKDGITSDQFRDDIEKIYFEMKKCLNE